MYGYQSQESYTPIDFDYDLTPDLPLISINPQEIGRVIINLVVNACYALHEKAQKTETPFSPKIRIKTLMMDKSLTIIILDNGPGISQENLSKIFQPFFTTKPTGKGNTVLGLSISYDIVVQGHQGRLSAKSELGVFTEFQIVLPVVGFIFIDF
ncbi:MAG: ATP-binding protein [Bacteroidia bacterium]